MKNNKGFTLVEVLAAITILSFIAIPMFNYFIQAYQYTTDSQNKTIAVNIARNVANYIEKQNFLKIKEFLGPDSEPSKLAKLDRTNCITNSVFDNGNAIDLTICDSVLNPTINNITYNENDITIYLTNYYEDKDITRNIKTILQGDPLTTNLQEKIKEIIERKTFSYDGKLIQFFVVVNWHEKREKIVLEGVIADEALR